MVKINWSEIRSPKSIDDISLVVATFHIAHSRGPKDLKVEVFENNGGGYEGVSNYGFWGPEQAGPYKSIRIEKTVEDALNDAVKGMIVFDKENFPAEYIFWVKDRLTKNEVYVDGNGEVVDIDEVNRRRSEYHTKYEKE